MYLCYSQERAAEKQPSIEPCLISSHNEGVNQRAEHVFPLSSSCIFNIVMLMPVISKHASSATLHLPIFLLLSSLPGLSSAVRALSKAAAEDHYIRFLPSRVGHDSFHGIQVIVRPAYLLATLH